MATGAFAQQTIKSSDVSAFNSINLSGKLIVELVQAEQNAIEITLYDSPVNKLKWAVKNQELSVNLNQSQGHSAYAEVKIYYTTPIANLTLTGVDMRLSEAIPSEMLTVTANGGAKVTMAVDGLDLKVEVGNSSAVVLEGTVKYLSLQASEKSRVDAKDLVATSADVEAGGSSEVYVKAGERLIATAKSAATIYYLGAPAIVRENISKIGIGASIHKIQ